MKLKKFPPRFSGVLLAIGATMIWSWNYIIARGFHEVIPPVTLSFLRWSVALTVITPFSIKHFIRDISAISKNVKYIILISFFGVTLFNTLVYIAGHSTEAINLSLIAITTPVFILIFNRIFFKEKMNIINIAGVFLTLSGIVILICRGSLKVLFAISFTPGDLWMLFAAITFALYSFLLRKKPAGIGGVSFLFVTFAAGLVMLLPFFLYEFNSEKQFSFSISIIFSILYIGIFASIGGFFMWNKAVEQIGAATSGIIYYSLPLFSTFWAILFLDEHIQLMHLVSLIFIISGILIATKKR